MSEEQQNAMIGKLVRQKRESEIAHATLDRKIKEIGEKLELLGSKLKTIHQAGDPKDLLSFLKGAEVGVDRIEQMLSERARLAAEIHKHTVELGKLGISPQ